jgi:hypothetical protein
VKILIGHCCIVGAVLAVLVQCCSVVAVLQCCCSVAVLLQCCSVAVCSKNRNRQYTLNRLVIVIVIVVVDRINTHTCYTCFGIAFGTCIAFGIAFGIVGIVGILGILGILGIVGIASVLLLPGTTRPAWV